MNEQIISQQHGRFHNPVSTTAFSIYYPSFDLLEKSILYQSFTHRLTFQDEGIDFNDFEEKHINPERSFEDQFKALMEDPRFKKIKNVYQKLSS